MLKTICYISNQHKELSLIELEKLYDQTKTKNDENLITGALLLIKDNFLQVIEGEETHINPLFEKITNDRRHHHIIVISNKVIEKRLFKDFDANYSIIDNFKKLLEFRAYVNDIIVKTQDNSLKVFTRIIDDIVRESA